MWGGSVSPAPKNHLPHFRLNPMIFYTPFQLWLQDIQYMNIYTYALNIIAALCPQQHSAAEI